MAVGGLEPLVRPFETPDTLVTGRIVPSQEKVAIAPAQMVWGAIGALPSPVQVPNGQTGVSFTVQGCDHTYKEDTSGRQTETKRVFNPTDNSQFVDVQRITSIKFVTPQSGGDQLQSYVSYGVSQALAEFSAEFQQSLPPSDCNNTFNLDWSKDDSSGGGGS